jgi:hypothetical protein
LQDHDGGAVIYFHPEMFFVIIALDMAVPDDMEGHRGIVHRNTRRRNLPFGPDGR